MKNRSIVFLTFFALIALFLWSSIYAQNSRKYIGFEYKNTKSILKDYLKLPGTFFNQEMKYTIEIFKDKANGQKYLFFQQYFTVEGNQSHRKIIDILALEANDDGYYSAMCFPNENQQEDIILGLYVSKKGKLESQIVIQPIKAWKTNFADQILEPTDQTKLQCLFGTPDDFPG
ncbi:hypothetical protein KJ966_03110 [bacterium]|nr:hypothetical protein [bacterium]